MGRSFLAAAVLVGWAVGWLVILPEVTPAVLFAFLAGGVVLNTSKEELPEQRQSNFWAFLLAAGTYAAILSVTVPTACPHGHQAGQTRPMPGEDPPMPTRPMPLLLKRNDLVDAVFARDGELTDS